MLVSIIVPTYNVERYIVRTLYELKRMKIDSLIEARYKKLRAIGAVSAEKAGLKILAGADHAKVAVQEIKSKSRHVPAKV